MRRTKQVRLQQIYEVHDFIDAKDKQGDWRVGYIVAKSQQDRTFTVRFDGWHSRYDQRFKFDSPKLKPFRTLVIGYTGQMAKPAIRQWKFTRKDNQESIQNLKLFLSQYEKCNAHQINQILRGQNYFYIDFLMGQKFESNEDLLAALDYFFINMNFQIKFLHEVNANLQEVSNISMKFLKIIEIKWQDVLCLTNKQAYYLSYYEIIDGAYIISGSYQRLAIFFQGNGAYWNYSTKQAKRIYQEQNALHFIKKNGLKVFSQIIQKLLKYQEFVSFYFLQSLAFLYHGFSPSIESADKESFITKFLQIVRKSLKNVRDLHIKSFYKQHHICRFVDAIIDCSQNTSLEKNILIQCVQLQLQLYLKMIRCPYLESQLEGISYIHKACQKNEIILKNGWFIQWMDKISLIKVFFAHQNLQFIKKACKLILFLNVKNHIRRQDVQLIWESRIDKHQTIFKEIYTLLSELPLYQHKYDNKKQLFRIISSIPKQDWDQDYITMIKDFSVNSYGLDVRQNLKQSFGFDIVYQYTKKTQSEKSFALITSLLVKIQRSTIFSSFQQRCFYSIEQALQPEIHIKLLLIICNNKLASFEQLSINMTCILINFITQISQTDKQNAIHDSFQLLSLIIRQNSKEIQIEDLTKLWRNFAASIHKDRFFSWLCKKQENGSIIINQFLNEGHKKYLLNIFWSTPEQMQAISQTEIWLFIELFRSVNTFSQKMKRVNVIIRPTSLELQGLSKIWNILKYCQNQAVLDQLGDLLVDITTSYQGQMLQHSIYYFIENIVRQIKSALKSQEMLYTSKLIQLTWKLVLRDYQIYNYQFTPKGNHIKQYTVTHQVTQYERIHNFNSMGSFYDFKKYVSKEWNKSMNKFEIYHNESHAIIKLQNYFMSMDQNGFKNCKFEIVQNNKESYVKECLSKHINLFFFLLDDKKIQQEVWDIVRTLPRLKLKLNIRQPEHILTEFQKTNLYHYAQFLRILLKLDDQWWDEFITTSNIEILIDRLATASFNNHIELQCFAYLTSIISKALSTSNSCGMDLDISIRLQDRNIQLLRNFLYRLEEGKYKDLNRQLIIIQNLFRIGQTIQIIRKQTSFIQQILRQKLGYQIFLFGLITISKHQICQKVNQQLKNQLTLYKGQWVKMLRIMLLRLLDIATKFQKRQHLEYYFDFTQQLLSKVPSKDLLDFLNLQGQYVCNRIMQFIKFQNAENINMFPNNIIANYLCLLRQISPFLMNQIQANVASFILNDCLFSTMSKCKSKISIQCAIKLLQSLCLNPAILGSTSTFLMQLSKKGRQRTRQLENWAIYPQNIVKSSKDYVRLKNLGYTCSINSFLQQLYMIPSFKQAIISCKKFQNKQKDKEENLLDEIKKMFLNLQYSEKKFYNPQLLCNAFKRYDKSINISQQIDIDEFAYLLFDRIEDQLKPIEQETLIKDIFGGVFFNEIICKNCLNCSQRQQIFLSISLTVKHKKNIYQSFDSMIKDDILNGENAYFCQKCCQKVSAIKRVCLKKFPKYLIVTLKRFQFDFQQMINVKINDYYQFPQNLNLQNYSWEYCKKNCNDNSDQWQSNDNFKYLLKGIVIHNGQAGGRYYSLIRDPNNSQWLQFNDTITKLNADDLAQRAFGQREGQQKCKKQSAYLLLYQSYIIQKTMKNQKIKCNQILKNQINIHFLQEIEEQNEEVMFQNILFSNEYSQIVWEILEKLGNYQQQMQKKILKYVIKTYLTVTVRLKAGNELYLKLNKIVVQLQRYPQLKQWVFSQLSQQSLFQQLFNNNASKESKKILSYWIADLYQHSTRQSQQHLCNLILNKLVQKNGNVLEYCLILYQICKNNNSSLNYLTSHHVVGRFIENIMQKGQKLFIKKLPLVLEVQNQIRKQIIIYNQKNVKKFDLNNYNGYVWAIINLVIAKSKQENIELKQYITKAQFQYIYLSDAKIYHILKEISNKFQMRQFHNFIVHLSKGNKQLLATLLNFVKTGIEDFKSKRYRQFFLLYQKIANVHDEYQQMRISGLDKILGALQHNEPYTPDSNITQQWILILANRNEIIRNYLALNKKNLQYLFDLSTKSTPSEKMANRNKHYEQFMINKYHGVKFPISKNGYIKLSLQLKQFYQRIIHHQFTQSFLWPSTLQTERKDPQVGEMVAYFDKENTNEYRLAKVEQILLGRLKLYVNGNRIVQVWKDDENIALDHNFMDEEEYNMLGSSSSSQREQLESLFEDL